MALNVMKQTRLIKTITGILLHNTAPVHAAVLFKTCFKKKKRGLLQLNPLLPHSPIEINMYVSYV
jgi:hypothetical protein